ncbi:CpaF family protein [Candidatus Micrarchaeota archaeon]|nr:CpaF family protein [Candidatus Micrarchaeota archaeon]
MSYIEDVIKRAKTASAGASAAPQSPEELGREKTLIDSYGATKIFRVAGEPLLLYEVPAAHYRGEEKALISAIIDLASRSINIDEALFQTQSEKRARYLSKVMEVIESSGEQLNIPSNSKEFYAGAVVQEIAGFGLIDPLIADDELEEIMVIGMNKPVYVFHRKYEMMKTNIVFYEDKDTLDLIDRIARNIGRRIDAQSPLLDARLPDGTRVNATIPPVSLDGSTITLRKFRHDPLSIIDLINNNTLNYEVAAFLWMMGEGMGAFPANVIIAGETAAGKTTLLNAMTGFIPNYERLITIEDTAELSLPFEHWVRFEVRPPGVEGTGEIDSDTLLKNALRMRPDRIIVGEIRGQEGYTLFSAMNTGHRGAMGTLHSNTARETLIRLTSPPMSVPNLMLSALNFIVMQQRIYDRRKGLIRRVSEIAEVSFVDENKLPDLRLLYQWNPAKDEITSTGEQANYLQEIARYSGEARPNLLKELEARGKILREMNEKGIRDMESVIQVTQNYSGKRQGKI